MKSIRISTELFFLEIGPLKWIKTFYTYVIVVITLTLLHLLYLNKSSELGKLSFINITKNG